VDFLLIYSVAVINLPISTMNTAGIAIPIKGTKIEGSRVERSDGINLLNIFKYSNIYLRKNVTFITG